MKIECIAIGDELLDGRVVEANAAWLGAFLFENGGMLSRVTTVSDDLHDIVGALEEARAPIVVVCGGLGPTADDRTRDAVACWKRVELVEDADTRERLEARFAARKIKITSNNYRQATFPAGAGVLATEVGSAAGFSVDDDTRRFYFFPGVPSEFRWFAETYIRPLLKTAPSHRICLHFFGRGESSLENDLQGLEELAADRSVRVGYRASFPTIEIKLAGELEAVKEVCAFVLSRSSKYLVGQDEEMLPHRVGRLLKEHGLTVTTAESCTAGGIAAAITDVAGSSAWFERGFVTYSNASKVDEIQVAPAILQTFGAVSAQTVCQMALGAQKRAGADFALAVSGIAGPDGGTPDKPVGTVHFGLATPSGVFHKHVVFPFRSREQVRTSTIYTALALLLAWLEGDVGRFRVDGPYGQDQVFGPSGIEITEPE